MEHPNRRSRYTGSAAWTPQIPYFCSSIRGQDRSGYSREQTREILESGIKGFFSKFRKGRIHRPQEVIQQGGEISKILEKSTWYLPREGQNDEPEQEHTGSGPKPGHRRGRGKWTKSRTGTRNPFAPVAPIFIPRTHGGASWTSWERWRRGSLVQAQGGGTPHQSSSWLNRQA